ncbi:MAG TPA: hypothetical protein VGE52_18590 [Pirellulales bacterium]
MFESSRSFQLWDYHVSHRQMLVRSPQEPAVADNIDLVFWGVEYVSLPTLMNGIVVRLANAGEQILLASTGFTPSTSGTRLFSVASGESQGFVRALHGKALRNTLDIFDSTLVYVFRDRPVEEYGEVLARF